MNSLEKYLSLDSTPIENILANPLKGGTGDLVRDYGQQYIDLYFYLNNLLVTSTKSGTGVYKSFSSRSSENIASAPIQEKAGIWSIPGTLWNTQRRAI